MAKQDVTTGGGTAARRTKTQVPSGGGYQKKGVTPKPNTFTRTRPPVRTKKTPR